MSIIIYEMRINFNELHIYIQWSNYKLIKIYINIIEIIVQNELRKKKIYQINILSNHYYYSLINIILKKINEI